MKTTVGIAIATGLLAAAVAVAHAGSHPATGAGTQLAEATGSGAHGPGEPGTQAETPNAPSDLRERYEQTPGAHAERPGKHSTTTGRHGTSGQVGGGVNTQSGAGVAPSENPVLDKRQGEEREAQSPD